MSVGNPAHEPPRPPAHLVVHAPPAEGDERAVRLGMQAVSVAQALRILNRAIQKPVSATAVPAPGVAAPSGQDTLGPAWALLGFAIGAYGRGTAETVEPAALYEGLTALGFDADSVTPAQMADLLDWVAPASSQNGEAGGGAAETESGPDGEFAEAFDSASASAYPPDTAEPPQHQDSPNHNPTADDRAVADDAPNATAELYSADRGDGTAESVPAPTVDEGATLLRDDMALLFSTDGPDNGAMDPAAAGTLDRDQLIAGLESMGYEIGATQAEFDALIAQYGSRPDTAELDSAQLRQAMDDGALAVGAGGIVLVSLSGGSSSRGAYHGLEPVANAGSKQSLLKREFAFRNPRKKDTIRVTRAELLDRANTYAQRLVKGEALQRIFKRGPREH